MTSLIPSAARPVFLTALTLAFLTGFSSHASAQRYLSDKAGATFFKQEADEDEPDPDVGLTGAQLTTSSNYTKTTSSSSSATRAPTIQAGTSYTRRGRTRTRDGYLAFSSEEDNYRSCAWYTASSIPLQYKTIRMYYKLKFDSDKDNENGEGTTIAFIPSTTTVSSTTCGGSGKYLGYGTNGSQALPAGHFGFEFDTQPSSSGMTDPGYNHFAIVLDENKHTGTSPTCASSSSGNTSSSPYAGCWTGANTTANHKSYPWLEQGYTNKFRLEITACKAADGTNVCASQGCTTSQTYLKGWACDYSDSSCTSSANFTNVNLAYTGSASATIAKCVDYDPATYTDLYLGFTFGTSDHTSRATYSNMVLGTADNK
jgi:hypothetical protein